MINKIQQKYIDFIGSHYDYLVKEGNEVMLTLTHSFQEKKTISIRKNGEIIFRIFDKWQFETTTETINLFQTKNLVKKYLLFENFK